MKLPLGRLLVAFIIASAIGFALFATTTQSQPGSNSVAIADSYRLNGDSGGWQKALAPANASVQIVIDGRQTFQTRVPVNGTLSYKVPTDQLEPGNHIIEVIGTSADGTSLRSNVTFAVPAKQALVLPAAGMNLLIPILAGGGGLASSTIYMKSVHFRDRRSGRIPTKFPAADNLLLGGVPRQTAVLLTTAAYDEKDDLIRAFCGSAPESTVFISADLNQCLKLSRVYPSLRVVAITSRARGELLPKRPGIEVVTGMEPSNIGIALMNVLKTLGDDSPRVYIQLLSDFLMVQKPMLTRLWLGDLLPRLRTRGCTVLAEVNPSINDPNEVQSIQDLFEGRIEITERDVDGASERFIRVAAFRGYPYLQEERRL